MSTPIKLAAAASIVGVVIASAIGLIPPPDTDPTELAVLRPAAFDYRQAGEFFRDGVPVNAPLVRVAFDRPLAIMKHHVSRADYLRCVTAKACRPAGGPAPADAAALPVVGVSWHDAAAYAGWLSAETGHRYRLPTDAEWAYAAGSLFSDPMIVKETDGANPAARWLATYESQAADAGALDPRPRPLGCFGINEHGVADMAGNVWDWTDTCFVRHTAQAEGAAGELESCGVRVVEGRHRTYLSDFIREPKGGSCSVGTPPANLGIRLVRDDDDTIGARIARSIRGLLARIS